MREKKKTFLLANLWRSNKTLYHAMRIVLYEVTQLARNIAAKIYGLYLLDFHQTNQLFPSMHSINNTYKNLTMYSTMFVSLVLNLLKNRKHVVTMHVVVNKLFVVRLVTSYSNNLVYCIFPQLRKYLVAA